MDKQEIIDYVQFTPENTNPAILSTMLDKFSSGPTAVLIPFKQENINNKNENGSRGTLTLVNPDITVDMIIDELMAGRNVVALVTVGIGNGNNQVIALFSGWDNNGYGISFVEHYIPSSSSDRQAARVFRITEDGNCYAYDNGIMEQQNKVQTKKKRND